MICWISELRHEFWQPLVALKQCIPQAATHWQLSLLLCLKRNLWFKVLDTVRSRAVYRIRFEGPWAGLGQALGWHPRSNFWSRTTLSNTPAKFFPDQITPLRSNCRILPSCQNPSSWNQIHHKVSTTAPCRQIKITIRVVSRSGSTIATLMSWGHPTLSPITREESPVFWKK